MQKNGYYLLMSHKTEFPDTICIFVNLKLQKSLWKMTCLWNYFWSLSIMELKHRETPVYKARVLIRTDHSHKILQGTVKKKATNKKNMILKCSKISNTSCLPKGLKTVQTQIRLLLQKQSDPGLHCLLF